MIGRVAYLSMHTSPLLRPGTGDAGGMNVYVDELAREMSRRGVEVDVFTRAAGNEPEMVEVAPGYRVHHIPAGPRRPLTIRAMAIFVSDFAEGVAARLEDPDIIHCHYWLSGWAGLILKRRFGFPLANSFHTLGRVKDQTRREDEPPESLLRIATEHEVIENADCVIASTPLEAEDLLGHYGADPARLCTSPPGVDHQVFSPGDQVEARARLGLGDGRIILSVGRIQPLKGTDITVAAYAQLAEERPDLRLVVVGGPSGPGGAEEMSIVERESRRFGERVLFHEPVPHAELVDYYRAADVLSLPSRSESFGLVAAEAQACGLPVVAARVGGLIHVVDDGVSGTLVDGWEPADHAAELAKILDTPDLRSRLSQGATGWSERFSWTSTVDRHLELYDGVVTRVRG